MSITRVGEGVLYPLRVMVGVKRVIDTTVKVRVNRERTAVDANAKTSTNPFDEVAIEESLRLRQRGHAADVVAVGVGGKKTSEGLRAALAMGVDRAILVEGLGESPEPLWVAKVLHKIMTRERISLAMLGRSASDTDDSQTGPMLAALANWPQATFASKIEWTFPENKASSAGTPGQTPGSTQGDPPSRVQIKVSRPVEDGKVETMILSLPAVITCDLRLNQPRTVRLQDVMKSQHKKLETINASSLLGIPPGTITQHTRTLCISDPPSRRLSPVTVSSVSELITKLKADGILP